MATKTIIFKNTTGSSITIRGKSIPASSTVDFTGYQGAFQYQLTQDKIDPLLASGDLVINNGIADLSVEEAEIYLYDELFFTMDGVADGDVLRGAATKGIALASPLNLDDLLDAGTGGAVTGDVLTFDGGSFVPQTPTNSTLIIQDEGTNIANTPHTGLNFEGDGVVVIDGGSGIATVTIAGVTREIPFFNQDTTQDNIALDGNGKIPFFNQDTSSDPIDLV